LAGNANATAEGKTYEGFFSMFSGQLQHYGQRWIARNQFNIELMEELQHCSHQAKLELA